MLFADIFSFSHVYLCQYVSSSTEEDKKKMLITSKNEKNKNMLSVSRKSRSHACVGACLFMHVYVSGGKDENTRRKYGLWTKRAWKRGNFDHQLIWSGLCIMNDAEEGDWLSKPSAKVATVKKLGGWRDEFAYGFMD